MRIFLFLTLYCVVMTGCALTQQGDITVRHYFQDKDRVDLNIDGNAGYLSGKPEVVDKPIKKTRKVYVMEIIQKTHNEYDMKKSSSILTKHLNRNVQRQSVEENFIKRKTKVVDSNPVVNLPTFQEDEAWGLE